MAQRKTTSKSTKRPQLVPRPNGRGALNSGGTPGNKGGRPRDDVKDEFRGLVDRESQWAFLRGILDKGPSDKHYVWAYELCVERGYGKSPQGVVEHQGEVVIVHKVKFTSFDPGE